jgi:RIO kinase 1
VLDDRRLKRLDRRVDAARFRPRDTDDRQVLDEVFDRRALEALSKLISDKVLDTVDYPVSTGKEGNVFHATAPGGRALALKIYRVSNATFRNLSKYIVGDPRFKRSGRSHREMIEAWAMKEFRNLQRMRESGVRVPEPVTMHRNLLLMEYVGDETGPAPVLRTVAVEDPDALYADLLESLRGIHRSGLVHGDLSEYNLLWWQGKVWVIDVGQAVPVEHGLAAEWHRRDLENLARYLRHLGLKVTADSLDAEVRA